MPRPAPFFLKGLEADRLPSYMNEKITLEPETWSIKRFSKRFSLKPDLGDQRMTVIDPLEKSRITPKRVIRKYRISAIVMGILGIASFTLCLMLLIGSKRPFSLRNLHMIKVGIWLLPAMEVDLTFFQLDTRTFGREIIQFDTVSATTPATPAATGSFFPDIVNALQPDDPNSPTKRSTDAFQRIVENLEKSLDDGLGDTINQVIDELSDKAGIKGVYTLYLDRVCELEGSGEPDSVAVEKCFDYSDAVAGKFPIDG
jgi:hypothetical protein